MIGRRCCPPAMMEIYSSLVTGDTTSARGGMVLVFFWARSLLPRCHFFLVDKQSKASLYLPPISMVLMQTIGTSSSPLRTTVTEQIHRKSQDLFNKSHICILEIQERYVLSAYNDDFLQLGERAGFLILDIPNELCRKFKKRFPAASTWERDITCTLSEAAHLFSDNQCR